MLHVVAARCYPPLDREAEIHITNMVTVYRYTTCVHVNCYVYTCLALSTLWPTTETQSSHALYNMSTSWLPISVLMLWHALENALKERIELEVSTKCWLICVIF